MNRKNICFTVVEVGSIEAFLRDHIFEFSKYYDVYLEENVKNELELAIKE